MHVLDGVRSSGLASVELQTNEGTLEEQYGVRSSGLVSSRRAARPGRRWPRWGRRTVDTGLGTARQCVVEDGADSDGDGRWSRSALDGSVQRHRVLGRAATCCMIRRAAFGAVGRWDTGLLYD
jgi:hypothetical protein